MKSAALLVGVITLEAEFRANLHDASFPCAVHNAEQAAVDATGGVLKLRVIEDIESFKSQFQRLGFGKLGVFQERHVKVVEAGAMEEAPIGVADLSQWFEVEERD